MNVCIIIFQKDIVLQQTCCCRYTYPVVFFVKTYLLFVLCIGKRSQLVNFCMKKTLGNNKTGCEDCNRTRTPPGGQSRHMNVDIRIWT